MYGNISDPEMVPYPPLVLRDLDVCRGSNSPSAVALLVPAKHRVVEWGGVPTSYGAVSTTEISVFVTGLLELYRYARISDPDIGTYPHQVRQGLKVGPRGNSCSALAP